LNNFQLKYKQYGEYSILIEWPSKIDIKTLEEVILFREKLEKLLVKEIIEIKSAYSSLLISYNTTIDNIYDEILKLKAIYSTQNEVNKLFFRQWKIPVCYDDEFALDLGEISLKKKMSKQDIIALHSQAIYTVFFYRLFTGIFIFGRIK